MFIEVGRSEIREAGTIKKAIEKGLFNIWGEERIRRAFSFGNGTMKDFMRYKKDNIPYCEIIEISEKELSLLYPNFQGFI